MSEEMEKSVVGDEPQAEGYAVDATGAVVRQETADADKQFAEQAGNNDWREQK